jgi:mono/diheme cytochrome c family protein
LRLAFFLGAAGVALVLLSNGARRASAQNQNPQRQNKAASAAPSGDKKIARGKYLVENVAMCGQCHTPRDSKGNFDRTRWLQGAAVPWQPATPDANWPLLAPRIGGTPPADDADMIKLLTTGTWTDGKWLRAPMPQFRMERGDAEAVVAYLKSLTPKP